MSKGYRAFEDKITYCIRVEILDFDCVGLQTNIGVEDAYCELLTFREWNTSQKSLSLMEVGKHGYFAHNYQQSSIEPRSDAQVEIVVITMKNLVRWLEEAFNTFKIFQFATNFDLPEKIGRLDGSKLHHTADIFIDGF